MTGKIKDYTNAYFNQGEQLDPARRDELIMTYTPLIKYIASRLASRLPPQVAVDDLISCGIVGLIDAINKFDPAKNVQFKTYAEFRIKGTMLDELRALDWVPRSVRRKITELERVCGELEVKLGRPPEDEEAAAGLGLELDEFHRLLDETKSVTFLDIDYLRRQVPDEIEGDVGEIFSRDDKDPFTALNLGETRNLLAQAIGELPEKEKLTVALYYHEELTMKEIGEVLGYTESRISQMHSKAMLRLRAKLKKQLDA
ncbi:MAG: FliA/WhiG family RNA polymerase sigma factor [Desulfurivibrio sp.]|nr:FliA/WhiG family RNA polymerase sigma factor [Desulfurivibrio sp.]